MKRILATIALVLLLVAPAGAATSSVTLAWDVNTEPDLAGYKLYHAATAGGPYTLAATLATVATWTHTGLADGPHCWVATAYDTVGNESGYSNEACRATDVTAPAPPTGLHISVVVKVEVGP
jgi:hypothetical protein